MRKFWFVLLALALCLMLSGTALAKGDKGNHGNDKGNSAGHGHDSDGDNRPPGWDKGKKTGWGDCDVPPGQAKKQGCNSTQVAHHHHHDRDEDRDHDRDRTVHHTYTHHTYTRHTRTTHTTTTRNAPGSNSSIILQRKGTTTRTPGTTQHTAVGSQVQDKKPAANPN